MTTSQLKIVAATAMLLDHIWFFFPASPILFHWIGRLAIPIFIFCCVLAFEHTRNRKKYIIRLYLFSLFMQFFNWGINGDFNFVRTLLLIVIVLYLWENVKQHEAHAKLYAVAFCLWELISSTVLILLIFFTNLSEGIISIIAISTANVMTLNGGIWFILIGVAMYAFRNSKEKRTASFIGITAVYALCHNTRLFPRISNYLTHHGFGTLEAVFRNASSVLLDAHPAFIDPGLFYGSPQWMMIFAIPLINSYQGKAGRTLKYFFYIFYPGHILCLYLLSTLIG